MCIFGEKKVDESKLEASHFQTYNLLMLGLSVLIFSKLSANKVFSTKKDN